MKLASNKNTGLYINDSLDALRISLSDESAWKQWFGGKVSEYALRGVDILSERTYKVTAHKGIDLSSRGGQTRLRGNNIKLISLTDFQIQSGNNLNINSNQINVTGQTGSNFLLDFPVPGDGTLSGNVVMNTAAGNFLIRSGLFPPTPGIPKANTSTFAINDLTFGSPTYAGRMGIGVAGHALLEGKLGGVWVSPVPLPLPGSTAGAAGRQTVPAAPIAPVVTPITFPLAPAAPAIPPLPLAGLGPQPIPMGGNLYHMLQKLVANLQSLSLSMSLAAPSWAISPMGPTVLNPLVTIQLNTFYAEMTSILTSALSPSPNPSGILSSLVFIDG